MLEELRNHLTEVSTSEVVGAVIIAAKPPVFSAGHNLKELVGPELLILD